MSKWVSRQDRGGLAAATRRATDDAYEVEGVVARPGVLVYYTPDGREIRELVPPSTLRDAEGLDSLRRAAMVLEHPAEKWVTPDNVARLGMGDVGDTFFTDDGALAIRAVLRRREAIRDFESGRRRQLSPGYKARVIDRPGVHPKYGRYDRIQVKRRYNHVAQTDRARGGATVALRFDAVEAPLSEDPHMSTVSPRYLALLFTLGAVSSRLAADGERFDSTGFERIKTDDDALGEATSLARKIEAGVDALAAKVEEVKTDSDDSAAEPSLDERLAWYDERRAVEGAAEALRLDSAEVRKLDNAAAKKLVVGKALGEDVSERSVEWIDGKFERLDGEGRFDSADGGRRGDGLDGLRRPVDEGNRSRRRPAEDRLDSDDNLDGDPWIESTRNANRAHHTR